MRYIVEEVSENELPAGIHHLIVERVEGCPVVLVNGPVARAWRVVRAYEDSVEPSYIPTVALPAKPLLQAV